MNKTAERALLARPLALCLGATAVVWLNPNLRQDTLFLWLAVIFAAPNLVLWLARGLRPVARVAPVVSPSISLLGWGTLATFTLGLKSPILAAFFFEVALAAVSTGPFGVLAVTSGAILVLCLVQSLFGLAAGWQLLLLEAGFLGVMGGLGFAMAHRRVAGEAALRTQSVELGQRLELLQRQLEDERVVSRVGENVARLAHGLKNAVHSLRGFVGLIEPEAERAGASREALAGLRAAIDDLERLARLTLAEPPSGDPSPSATASLAAPIATSPSGSRAPATRDADGRRPGATAGVMAGLEAAVRELGPIHPRVEFALRGTSDARLLAVRLGEMPLQELLTILLRNAVEAMRGAGRCTVDVERQGDRCRISIGDEGEGLPPEAGDRLFTPGFTTKPGGSGFGLFLARRIVEDQGGTLRLVAGAEKGAVAQLELPLASGAGGASADAPEQRGARAEGGVG
jgi:signal transduction histidine kinase